MCSSDLSREARVQEDMLASLSSSIKPTQDKLNHLLGQADTTLTGEFDNDKG